MSYGEIDVDRLLNALAIVRDPETNAPRIGMVEKGLSALESLLFARYQMYRNVYWHHAVRSATVMYKRLVADALDAGTLDARALAAFTDEGLLHALADASAESRCSTRFAAGGCTSARSSVPRPISPATTPSGSPTTAQLTAAVENQLAREVRLQPGELLLDYPAKTQMLGLDLLIQRPYGDVRRVTAAGWEGVINLPRLSEEFYRSARWLRVFTSARMAIDPARFMEPGQASGRRSSRQTHAGKLVARMMMC